jgi:phosphoribosylformylglycinamidine cyclo-ligase
LPGTDAPLGKLILEPTTIYVKPVLALMSELDVRALAHITGGGLLENIPRTLPSGLGVRLEAGWPVPSVFRWLAQAGPIEPREMLRTFNMGIGMTVVVPAGQAPRAVEIANGKGVAAQVIGQVVERSDGEDRVIIEGVV